MAEKNILTIGYSSENSDNTHMTMNRQFFCINQDKNIDEAIMSASSFPTFLFYWLWLYIDGQLPKGIATSRKIEVNIILYLNILSY